LLAVIAFGSLASAQTTTKCSVTFSGGAGNFAFKYCVTKNGNIARMETPLTFQHLSTSNPSEGYGICDLDTKTAYYDYAGGGATSNWDPPLFLSLPPAPVVIERRTSDGRWQLTQTFTASGADSSFQVKMELLNRDPSKTKKANLVRFANVNIDGSASNIFQITPFSVVAGSTLAGSPGIQLKDAGKADNTPLGLSKPNGPNPCNPTANSKAPFISSDGAEELLYVRTVPNNGTKTATVLYRPF
jgi:hypothetical protein